MSNRFPEPLLVTSGGQATQGEENGVRGTYTTSTTSSILFELYGSQASTSGGDFGSWILPAEGDLGNILANISKTLNSPKNDNEPNELDEAVLMNKLWVSAILRDNIVTSFGYVLYRPNNPLPAELYSSLYIIYNYIRLRRISTVDIFPVVKEMSYSSPQEQFLIVFEELYRQIPDYLKSSAAQWVEALAQNTVNINVLIRPGEGPVEVDFLASLESSSLNALEEESFFKKETIKQSSAYIKVLMGHLFSYVFSAISDGSMKLTQPLFALILLHLPLDSIVPQQIETERYIIDALRLNNIQRWDSIIAKIQDHDLKDPFKLVRAVLQSIVDEPQIESLLKIDAAFVLPHVKAVSQTFANRHYEVMSQVVGTTSIKFKTLLRHITVMAFPHEVVELKERVLYYVNQGYIDISLVSTGFIRYDYTTPNDLLIAIINRIYHRLPNLSEEIIATVKALQQALIFDNLHSSLSPVVPPGFIHVPSLLDAFGNPSFPVRIRILQQLVSSLLMKETIDWSSLVNYLAIEDCSSPRHCFVTVITKAIVKGFLTNSPALEHIEEILKLVDRLGNVIEEITECPSMNVTEPLKAENITRKSMPVTKIPKAPKSIWKPYVTEEFNEVALQNRTYPTAPRGTRFPPFSVNFFYVPGSFDQREQLLPPTVPFSPEDILLKPIRDFITRPDLLIILGQDFQPDMYPTKALLFKAILQKASFLELVKSNSILHRLIKRYLQFLAHQIQTYKPSINYGSLLDALPEGKTDLETHYLKVFKEFLTSGEIDKYFENFDFLKFQTRGKLLQNIMRHLLTVEDIGFNIDLYNSIQYFIDKIYANGFGAKPIEFGIAKREVRRRMIDLQSTLMAINVNALDHVGARAFRGVLRFFADEFQPPIHLSNFEFVEPQSKGEWLVSYFQYLTKHPAVSQQAKRNISYIIPYVLLDGPGAEMLNVEQ